MTPPSPPSSAYVIYEWSQSESSILELNFKIKKHHVRRGGIEIRCEASIMNGYHSKSKLEEIFVKTHNAEKMNTHNYEYRYVLKKN